MSKAEDKALEAYPIDSYEGHDDMYRQRGAFAKGYEQAMADLKADAIDGVIFGSKFFRQKNISLENLTVEQYDRLKDFGEHVKVVIL